MKKIICSESVTAGHPDKICDQISDAILDEYLKQDIESRVACETLVSTGMVVVTGEITSKANVNIQEVVRKTIREIGYDDSKLGFEADSCAVLVSIDKQSEDIARGVDKNKLKMISKKKELGAGDQGMMYGYASNESKDYIPLTLSLAHTLTKRLDMVRKDKVINYLRPDGKSQVTIEYDEDKPLRIDSIILSAQHNPEISRIKLERELKKYVIDAVIPEYLIDENTKILINPTGRFVVGGPKGDAGLTGRKIIVDTYGGLGRHGGGAFSGKDPTKVDRSGAYAARWVAKNLVAAGVADKIEVQLAYAIGVSEPLAINVDTFGTGIVSDERIIKVIKRVFDLKPESIIRELNLRQPIYKKTAVYGHFGRDDKKFPWENLNKVKKITKLLYSV